MSSQPLTDLSPVEILDTALQEIQSKGIEPVEWFPLLHLRMNVPRVVMHYSFLVPDADFQRASDLLEHMGLPLQTPSEFSLLTRGDMEAKGRSHLLRKLTFDYCLVVYPLSFAAFRHYELSEQPVQYSRLHRCSHILVPRPSAVYASLMRMMRRHPSNSSNWSTLRAEMADLHLYHLLGYTLETISDEEDEEDENKRMDVAVETIREWSARKEWGEGEEWMESALCGFLRGEVQ